MDKQQFIINELAIELANLKIELAMTKADIKERDQKIAEYQAKEEKEEESDGI